MVKGSAISLRLSGYQKRWLDAASFVLGITAVEIARRGLEQYRGSLPDDVAERIQRGMELAGALPEGDE